MAANVDALRQGYEAYGRGDVESAMEVLDDDVRWEGPPSEKVPGGGTFNGKEEVGQLWQEFAESFDDLKVEPDEFLEGEETVTVLGNTSGRAKETGNDFKVPFVHVWRFSDEGKANRVQTLTDTATVADAIGAG
jgi:ketosteroid isomerase-like protein